MTLPTGEEIDRLTELVNRDPGSAAFVDLGEAYLALSRPRDAIEVGARGLRIDPSNTAGRLMVGRAFAALHKWKEAQAELLKVVKADRNSSEGFRLLGEVLMRRADYDRALPVLQHAQNLNPADAQVLGMLRRAREGRPLDPPAPIPSPQQPAAGRRPARASRPPPPPPGRAAADVDDDDPTRVAGEDYAATARLDDETRRDVPAAPPGGALGRMDLDQVAMPGDARAPRERGVRRSDDRGNQAADVRVQHHAPPPPEDPLAPLGGEGSIRSRLPLSPGKTGNQPALGGGAARPQARPAAAVPPDVRPRVLEAGKKADRGEARKALRTSAAVGEQYLNSLLTNGMLDVPNVRVPKAPFVDVVPDKMWGRSSRRMFIALFVLLFLGVGGGVGYYIWQQKQTEEAVAAHLAEAKAAIQPGTYAGLRAGLEQAMAALERDQGNVYATAVWAELGALDLLLYGEPPGESVDHAISTAARSITEGSEGARELAIARAARELASIDGIEEGEEAEQKLGEIRAQIASALEAYPDELLLHWLRGVALQKAGDREGARAAFDRADADGSGPLAARISRANLLLDDGEYDAAFELYDDVLSRSKGHPWALIGRSLARSERSIEGAEAVADLNVKLADEAGPRIAAWKTIATAATHLQLDDYEAFAKSISPAVGVREPRYLVRVALAHLDLGKIAQALKIRQAIKWASQKPQPHPLVATLDAELFLATGLPDAARSAVEEMPGLAAARARGRALFDLGRYDDALAALDEALKAAPEDREALMWREAARMVARKSERRNAAAELDKLGLQAKAKDVRLVHGLALLALGDPKAARDKLEQSVDELTEEYPNPLAYRSHAELAALDLQEDRAQSAELHLEAALAQNPGYLPARGMMGRVLLRAGDPNGALENLVDVVAAEVATAADELAFAEALVAGGDASDEDRAQAREALARAAKKGASDEEVARVAALVDPEEAAPPTNRRRRRERARRRLVIGPWGPIGPGDVSRVGGTPEASVPS